MIIVVGDTHGRWDIFHMINRGEFDHENLTVIQVGDLGFYKRTLEFFPDTKYKVLAIDGNHEDHEYLHENFLSDNDDDVVKIKKNLHYVRRGTVMEIEGKTFGFLGGACSVDKYTRIAQGIHWSPLEQITEEDVQRLLDNAPDGVDYLITHAPPVNAARAVMGPLNKLAWGLPMDWEDRSAQLVQDAWTFLNRPWMYCGHLHKSAQYQRCNILDINQVVVV